MIDSTVARGKSVGAGGRGEVNRGGGGRNRGVDRPAGWYGLTNQFVGESVMLHMWQRLSRNHL